MNVPMTFILQYKNERLGRSVTVDDAYFDLMINADVNGFLSAWSTATHGCASLAGRLAYGGVHLTHPVDTGSTTLRRRNR